MNAILYAPIHERIVAINGIGWDNNHNQLAGQSPRLPLRLSLVGKDLLPRPSEKGTRTHYLDGDSHSCFAPCVDNVLFNRLGGTYVRFKINEPEEQEKSEKNQPEI